MQIAVVGKIVNDDLNSGIMEITWLRHFNHTKPVWFVAKMLVQVDELCSMDILLVPGWLVRTFKIFRKIAFVNQVLIIFKYNYGVLHI